MKTILILLAILLPIFCFAQNEIVISDGDIGIRFEMESDTAVVIGFQENSPAKKAGIKKRDRIISIDDCEVSGLGTPESFIRDKMFGLLGSSVKLSILRDKNIIQFNVERGEVTKKTFHFPERIEYIVDTSSTFDFNTISSKSFSKNFIPRGVKELTIGSIDKGSIADSLGLKENDQIIKVNGTSVFSIATLKSLLDNHIGQRIDLTLKRDSSFVNIQIEDSGNENFFEYIGIKSLADLIPESKIHWVRLILKPNILYSREFVILTNDDNVDTIELYAPNHDGTYKKRLSGNVFNYFERDFPIGIKSACKLFLANNENIRDTLFLKLVYNQKSGFDSKNSVTILSQSNLLSIMIDYSFNYGLFFGIILIMILHNVVLYLFSRNLSYLYFLLYILTVGLNFLILFGFAVEYLWPNKIYIDKYIEVVTTYGLFFFYTLFSKYYLKTKRYLPRWNKVLDIQLILSGLIIIFEVINTKLLVPIPNLIETIIALIFVSSLIAPIVPSIILSRKHNHAIFFLVANTGVLISLIVTVSTEIILFPVGVILQIFLFSIGLGESIRQSEMEKKKAQDRIILHLKENELLKDKVNRELEQKVKERTAEIEQQKEEITAQRDEIEAQRDEIEAQRDLVIRQKEEIEKTNEEITDSIVYAKYIQSAVLPHDDIRDKLLPEHFILYKPKDIVSGDFYWITKVEERIIVAAADCTGHGVPGAFMSMLGISFLNDIVNKEYITHPGVILRRLRKEVIHALQQTGEYGEQRDGMDIALCSIDFRTLELQFAGANNPLYIVRNKELEPIKIARVMEDTNYNLYELKGDKMPIAIHERMDKYLMHEVQLVKGDCLYMFSDGYADQFGGEQGRKFQYTRFKKLMLTNASENMSEQLRIFVKTLEQWQGSHEQVDDILVVGIRI